MKIAALLLNRSSEKIVLSSLASEGIRMTAFADIGSLARGLGHADYPAVVLEDGPDLPAWLATLAIHSPASVPKIAVGASGGLSRALSSGADDYATLNDGARNLVRRLQAIELSRQAAVDQRLLKIGAFSLDVDMLAVHRDGHAIALTSREFQLAWMLFANHKRVVSTKLLASSLWGRSPDDCKRSIEQYVYRLRRKIEGALIHAVYGVGYRLELCNTAADSLV